MHPNSKRLYNIAAPFFVLNLLLVFTSFAFQDDIVTNSGYDWKQDWLIEDGFKISTDAKGFNLPTAIAFVPEPGPDPKDPLYYVTELRGKVKVVTNDRSVYTFADLADDDFNFTPKEELPSGLGQGGCAGIGLDPVNGYVFVTSLYRDKNDIMRNNIVRFETKPGTFAILPGNKKAFTELFSDFESGLAHHIGPCVVKDGYLYVSIGEAWQPFKTLQVDQLYGKILRMTLDGKPVPGNPFYKNDSTKVAENYVWCYGLRNSFGIKFVGERLFAADNGMNIDRFIEIIKGENYQWNGSDNSIAMNAKYIWTPALGPVQMDFYAGNTAVFPKEYNESFFVALSGAVEFKKMPGIFMIKYSMQEDKIVEVPKHFLKYKGKSWQMVTGLAMGPDGLYFSPIFPDQNGETKILKITYGDADHHPFTLVQNDKPIQMFIEKGCVGCHSIDGTFDYGGGAAPPIVRGNSFIRKISSRVFSEGYMTSLKKVDESTKEKHVAFKAARNDLLMTQDSLERVKIWLVSYLQEPEFDKTYHIQMPNLGLTADEANLIADYLLERPGPKGFADRIKQLLKPPFGFKQLALVLFGGMIAGFTVVFLYVRIKK